MPSNEELTTLQVDIDLVGRVAMTLVRRGYEVFMEENTDYLHHPEGIVTVITTASQEVIDGLEKHGYIRLK